MCSGTCIHNSGRGRNGSTTTPMRTGSGLASLLRIEADLIKLGYTTNIEEVYGPTLRRGRGALSTTTAWRLTWSWRSPTKSAHCGSLSVATGEALGIPSISASPGSRVDD